jgi:hypothetical protein
MNFDDWDGSGLLGMILVLFIGGGILLVVHVVAEKLKLIKHHDAPDEERMGCGNLIMSSVVFLVGCFLAVYVLFHMSCN